MSRFRLDMWCVAIVYLRTDLGTLTLVKGVVVPAYTGQHYYTV